MAFEFLIADTGLDLAWFIILCGVSFLGSFITASLGLGGGLLMVATLALALPPIVLIPVHAVVQLGSNLSRTILFFKSIVFSIIPAFLIGTIIGIYIGTQFIVSLPTHILQIVLAAFILYTAWVPKFQASNPGKKTFFGLGVAGAFISMFVGATGPLVMPFITSMCKERHQIVGTHGLLIVIQHTAKIISFGLMGFAFGPYIPFFIGMICFAFAGTYAGKLVLTRLPEKTFRTGLKIILTLIAIRLLYKAFF